MPGPAPKPRNQRRRPNSGVQPTSLPAERSGPVPDWPLGAGSKAERDLWSQLWRSPQAVMWERHGWTRAVARYARLLILAEKKDAPVTLLGEVRQMEDRLGLSPMAMKRLGWEVVSDGGAEVVELKAVSGEPPRVKAFDPDAVARP